MRRDDGHLSSPAVANGVKQPTRGPGRAPVSRFRGRCPSIRPCSGWGLPASRVTTGPGALLPHRFTLACTPTNAGAIGGLVSVALAVAPIKSKRLGVTQHLARWSPDFPPRRGRGDRPAALVPKSLYAHAAQVPRYPRRITSSPLSERLMRETRLVRTSRCSSGLICSHSFSSRTRCCSSCA
jgi:hypothetical protein